MTDARLTAPSLPPAMLPLLSPLRCTGPAEFMKGRDDEGAKGCAIACDDVVVATLTFPPPTLPVCERCQLEGAAALLESVPHALFSVASGVAGSPAAPRSKPPPLLMSVKLTEYGVEVVMVLVVADTDVTCGAGIAAAASTIRDGILSCATAADSAFSVGTGHRSCAASGCRGEQPALKRRLPPRRPHDVLAATVGMVGEKHRVLGISDVCRALACAASSTKTVLLLQPSTVMAALPLLLIDAMVVVSSP